MSDPFKNRPMPKPILWGAAALVLFSLTITAAHSWYGFGAGIHGPGNIIAVRSLTFADTPGGGIAVTDDHSANTVATIAPQSGHFVRSLVRLLAKERLAHGGDATTAFDLILREGGYLSLYDPVSERTIELNAFGADNLRAFASFLDLKGKRS